jgi:aminoglycoside phosphotransferase (APT) family kinase protein
MGEGVRQAREQAGLSAEARARRALTAAGLETDLPLQRARSNANEVWLAPEFVLRVNYRGDLGRLGREAAVAARLPAEARYPGVLAHGVDGVIDWLIVRRVPGTELSRAWPGLAPSERRRAVSELAEILSVVHAVDAPGLPADRDMAPPHVLPLDRVEDQAARVAALAFVDGGMLADVASFIRGAWGAFDAQGRGLVHGDPHLENVLCDGGHVTALIDLEWSRLSWIEVDLEILLSFCAFPAWFVAEDYEDQACAADYEQVPAWLAAAYPRWFAHPRLAERLAVLSLSRHLGALIDYPPQRPVDVADPKDRRNHLRALLTGARS